MEELAELKRRLEAERPADWDALPDIALYMDQVVSYLPRQQIRFDDREAMTSAMVNNYIKDGLLPRAEGKRYNRTHLAYLTAIGDLKQVLSVKDMATLIPAGNQDRSPEVVYAAFLEELDTALRDTAAKLPEDMDKKALPRLALALALRSYADRLACQRIIELLRPEEPEKKRKNKSKENKEK